MYRTKGFSLIEVLIALIILAIAFLAIMETTQSNIRSSIHVKNTLTADWVALNLMSSLQANIMKAPSPGSQVSGRTTMLNQVWRWAIKADSTNANASYERATVTIYQGNQQIQSLTGFIPLVQPK